MRQTIFTALLCLLLITGCNQNAAPPPDEEAPPPPPTADELYNQLRNPLNPLFNSAANNSPISNAQRTQAVSALRPIKLKMASEPNAPEAYVRMVRDIEDMIKAAEKAENYRVVKGGIEAYKIFEPAEKKYDELEQYADLVLARPSVEIQGFFAIDNEPVVFIEVTDADDVTDKETYKVREGEDFHEGILQLLRVVGNNQGIEVMYKPIEQKWIVTND